MDKTESITEKDIKIVNPSHLIVNPSPCFPTSAASYDANIEIEIGENDEDENIFYFKTSEQP